MRPLKILGESKILTTRRSPEERSKNYQIALQKKIQQYMKDGGKGDLDLNNTPITSLPNNLKVGGYLDLWHTPITSLPNNLEVRGYLSLNYTPITSLPNNLEVGGYLDLSNTPITSLPDNLKVGGNLHLSNTPITSLPNNLQVGGFLNLDNTPLSSKTEAEIRQMAPGIKGRIIGLKSISESKILTTRRSPEERSKNYQTALQKKIQQYIKDGGEGDLDLRNTPITSLPNNLEVGGYLNLANTPITSLPNNLKVRSGIDLEETPITSLPNNLQVGGSLDLTYSDITSLPNDLKVRGSLYLGGTPLSSKTEAEIRQMAPGIKGEIFGLKN
jgi:hypothetical protein